MQTHTRTFTLLVFWMSSELKGVLSVFSCASADRSVGPQLQRNRGDLWGLLERCRRQSGGQCVWWISTYRQALRAAASFVLCPAPSLSVFVSSVSLSLSSGLPVPFTSSSVLSPSARPLPLLLPHPVIISSVTPVFSSISVSVLRLSFLN